MRTPWIARSQAVGGVVVSTKSIQISPAHYAAIAKRACEMKRSMRSVLEAIINQAIDGLPKPPAAGHHWDNDVCERCGLRRIGGGLWSRPGSTDVLARIPACKEDA